MHAERVYSRGEVAITHGDQCPTVMMCDGLGAEYSFANCSRYETVEGTGSLF